MGLLSHVCNRTTRYAPESTSILRDETVLIQYQRLSSQTPWCARDRMVLRRTTLKELRVAETPFSLFGLLVKAAAQRVLANPTKVRLIRTGQSLRV